MDISKLISQENSLQQFGLLVERCPDGALRANVPHLKYHSPTGYECGYAGSGPADLALSVLHALLPPLSEEEEVAQYELEGEAFDKAIADPSRWTEKLGPDRLRVCTLAVRLHQQFKMDFIARMPKEGGHVPIADIHAWIERQRAELAERA
jgi:hypothetical protein